MMRTLLQRLGLRRSSFEFRYGGRTVKVIQYPNHAIVKTGKTIIGTIGSPVAEWWDPQLMRLIRDHIHANRNSWREWE